MAGHQSDAARHPDQFGDPGDAGNHRLVPFLEIHTYREFCQALKVGKSLADDRVERSLYQRAVGYSYNAVKVMQHNGEPVYAEYVEHVPPDPGAAKLWLTNRRSEEWREKTHNELTGKNGSSLVPVLNVTISREPEA